MLALSAVLAAANAGLLGHHAAVSSQSIVRHDAPVHYGPAQYAPVHVAHAAPIVHAAPIALAHGHAEYVSFEPNALI